MINLSRDSVFNSNVERKIPCNQIYKRDSLIAFGSLLTSDFVNHRSGFFGFYYFSLWIVVLLQNNLEVL